MSGWVMICRGLADGSHCDADGMFLVSFNAEAAFGLGTADWSHDLRAACIFPSVTALFAEWNRIPLNRWLRSDGKPNRPLTMFTIEAVPYDALAETDPY